MPAPRPTREAALERLGQDLVAHPGRGGCGVGAIAALEGPSRRIVDWALHGLGCMEHRGGCLQETGDGAGLLLRTPRSFFERHLAQGRHLRPKDHLSVGVLFFPPGEEGNLPPTQQEIDFVLRRQGLTPLGWRKVPVNDRALGAGARRSQKAVWQLLIGDGMVPREDLPRALFRVKAQLEHAFRDLYVASLSPDTVVYKAMATGPQFRAFYPDLDDEALTTDLVVFHRRYSTNTFSNWYLAQPFRVLGHNGEINTIKAVREAAKNLEAELNLPGLFMHQGSDSADLDRMVELLVASGVPLLEALVRILPPAWNDRPGTDPKVARWQAGVRRAMGSLGAWEGPAAVVATDGRQLVGILDRMGLRPMRYVVTRRDEVVLASEIGAVPLPAEDIAETGQLEPGEALAVDLERREIVRPDAVAERLVSTSRLDGVRLSAQRLFPATSDAVPEAAPLDERGLVLFGWTTERVKAVAAMAKDGKEPLSSMGFDRPLAVFSPSCPTLPKYFRQIIAVVTNPPIDPIREGSVMDISVLLGPAPEADIEFVRYEPEAQYRLESPFLSEAAMHAVLEGGEGRPQARVLDATYDRPESGDGDARELAHRIAELVREGTSLVRRGEAGILVVSDRRAAETLGDGAPPARLPLPPVLLVSALHVALSDEGLRRRTSLVVDTGELQEGHDAAVYLANGADAVHPWLFLAVCRDQRRVEGDPVAGGFAALEAAVSRILSKMGITTLEGYRGSRLFEAVGISPAVVDYYLPGVTSRLGGIDLDDIHMDALTRGRAAGAEGTVRPAKSPESSIYRKEVWHELQLAARGEDPEAYRRFLDLVDKTPPVYLRDLLEMRAPNGSGPGPGGAIGEEEVAPPEWIIATTFRAAAMSHGALHRVAHRAIAAAFNRFGARSNSGEGGEDARRDRGGPWQADRSRIRQVASGRFGVDARYLVNADELDIKIGQGAKPGEGGHLPGHKITAEIARIRKTREGVTLISPPPHHDIYSIEDLAQLVYNLRQINPRAAIGVKIPTVTDIGTIAVGVVKAGADVITVSGAEGGTGAAAASSIEHAGLPLERGLAEVHQALVVNGVREGVVLRVDGGIKTGEDVVKLLALGADEVALGTALMIAEQCVFCHGCAKGNCPAGITTQDEDVAKRLMQPKGKRAASAPQPVMALAVIQNPDDDEEMRYLDAKAGVERYLTALAHDVRRHLARLGLRTPTELVGRTDLLRQVPSGEHRADKVDLTALLVDAHTFDAGAHRGGPVLPGDRTAPSDTNRALLEAARARTDELAAGDRIGAATVEGAVTPGDRAVGATLAGEIAAGRLVLSGGGLRLSLTGEAGQALGFGLVAGMTLELTGYANDTVGEAMSGGRIVVKRPPEVPRSEEGDGSAAGNAVAYGMTGGELFIEGRCGQRLGVRMSEGLVVCEGAGKYAFEYMTGGTGVVLGPVGGQACSGMTGGVVYLWDREGDAATRLNADANPVPATEDELAALKDLVSRFAEATGSPLGARLVADWDTEAARMVKVVPR